MTLIVGYNLFVYLANEADSGMSSCCTPFFVDISSMVVDQGAKTIVAWHRNVASFFDEKMAIVPVASAVSDWKSLNIVR